MADAKRKYFRFSNIFWAVDYDHKIQKNISRESLISAAYLTYFIVFYKMLIVGFIRAWKWRIIRFSQQKSQVS